MLRVLFSPSDDWTAVNVSNRFLVTELSLWLIYFFLTFPTLYAARVFPPSDDWTVVNVSIWFLVTGLSPFLYRLAVYSVLHALGHYLITEMSSNALAS
jgi:hypothetical protein